MTWSVSIGQCDAVLLVNQLVQPQLAKNKVKLIFSCLKCSIVTTSGEFLLILASFGFWIETTSRPPSSISVFSRLKLTKRDYFILDLERNWRNNHLRRVEHFESFIAKFHFWLVHQLEMFDISRRSENILFSEVYHYELRKFIINLEISLWTWKLHH